jgi:hypothetical protein
MRRIHSGLPQYSLNNSLKLAPFFLLSGKLLTARFGKRVEAGAPVIFRAPWLRANPALLLHSVKAWIQRTFVDVKPILGEFRQTAADRVTVPRLSNEDAQNEQIKRTLQQSNVG